MKKSNKFLALALAVMMTVSLAACTSTPAPPPAETTPPATTPEAPATTPPATIGYTAGTYEATSRGHNGDVKVAVTVDADKITKIEVLSHRETPGVCTKPLTLLPEEIIKEQSLKIETITGATFSSNALLAAVADCIKQAGGDVDALKATGPEPPKGGEKIEKTADVIIVGGGGAGLAAAVSASDAGASVILIEKMGYVGGNTMAAGGIYNCPDPALQEPAGVEDSVEFFATQTWEAGDKVANFELVTKMAAESYDGLKWLESMGMEFKPEITQGAGSLYKRTHSAIKPLGTGFIDAYMDTIATRTDKVEIIYNTTGKTLLTEGEKVVGVTAVDKYNNEYTFKANNAVILATGGFAGNVEIRQKYNTSGKFPDLGPSVMNSNMPGVTGDGIFMAEAVGANLIDMEQIQLLHMCNPKNGSVSGITEPLGVEGCIFVNKEGNRFVREDGRRDEICKAMLEQTGGMMYDVQSGEAIPDPTKAVTLDGVPVQELVDSGDWFMADTLEDLAKQTGMSYENLRKTVDDYNASIGSEKDEFGRTLLTTKFETGPWYANPRVPAVHHTMGGVQIDLECRVLNKEGKPIEGLIAAGEITGGIHGGNRVGGNALVDTVVFGRVAGTTAAGK